MALTRAMVGAAYFSRKYSIRLLARTLARIAQTSRTTSNPKNGVTGQAPCKANMKPVTKLTAAANPITSAIAQGFIGRLGSIFASRNPRLPMDRYLRKCAANLVPVAKS